MRTILTILLLILALAGFRSVLSPAAAQDGDGCGDGCTTIEDGDDDDDEQDAEDDQRKKNAGLAGGGKRDDGDANAPKVKVSLQEQINKAIKNGVKWLKKAQKKDGSYGPVKANRKYGSTETGDFTRDPTAPTAFAIYALAKCGVKRSDPVIKKGLRWLRDRTYVTFDTTGKKVMRKQTLSALTTYESAAIVLMIEAVFQQSAKLTGKLKSRKLYSDNPLKPPRKSRIKKDDWLWMHNRILHLTKGRRIGGGGRGRGGKGSSTTIKGTQNTQGNNAGGWRYGQANGDADLSATQFVLLALRAATQAGYPMEKTASQVFSNAAKYTRNLQIKNSGGFGYQRGQRHRASMTACGIASLVMCREQMAIMKQPIPGWMEPAIKKGLDHLDTVFDVRTNKGHFEGKGSGGHHYYYLYAVERVGDLTGRKEFAGKDWYVRGARLLVGAQQPDGKWVDQTAFPPRDILGTCYALLFLKRATPPTVTFTER